MKGTSQVSTSNYSNDSTESPSAELGEVASVIEDRARFWNEGVSEVD